LEKSISLLIQLIKERHEILNKNREEAVSIKSICYHGDEMCLYKLEQQLNKQYEEIQTIKNNIGLTVTHCNRLLQTEDEHKLLASQAKLITQLEVKQSIIASVDNRF
jgi:hypothetical protein